MSANSSSGGAGGNGTRHGQPTPQNPQGATATAGGDGDPGDGTASGDTGAPPADGQGNERGNSRSGFWRWCYRNRIGLGIVGFFLIILFITIIATQTCRKCPSKDGVITVQTTNMVLPQKIVCEKSKIISGKDAEVIEFTSECTAVSWSEGKLDGKYGWRSFPAKITCPKGHKAKPTWRKAIGPDGKEEEKAVKVEITGCYWEIP